MFKKKTKVKGTKQTKEKKIKNNSKTVQNAVLPIRQHIQNSNAIMIKIMVFLIIFSVLNLGLSAYFAKNMRDLSERSSSVETARNYVNTWVTDLIISITEGSEFTNVTSLDNCDYAKWRMAFDITDVKKDKEAKAAFDKALELHDEIHLIYKNNLKVTLQDDPEQGLALVNSITAKYEEFSKNIKSIEDYNQRWLISTLLRFLRFISFYMTLFLPALYVALVSYHPELIPTQLLFTIAASREGVPFPSLIEALIIALFYEILQEAGTRLPRKIGQTIGIVGGIVIGEIAVQAGIVTPLMVIAISLTAIAAFTLPNYSLAIGLRVMRFGAIFAATILGLYGIILVFIMIHIHLANLKSIGIPYSAPFAPNYLGDLKNVIIRAPITTLTKQQTQPFLEPADEVEKTNGGSGTS